MDKNIILQHYTGVPGELEELSMKNVSRYAESVGAEYKFLQGQVFREHLTPECQKVFMLDESFDDYDNVMMLDIDMFVNPANIENVFEVPGIGLHNKVQAELREMMVGMFPLTCSIKYPYWGGAIYKMNRAHRQILRSGMTGDFLITNRRRENPYRFVDEGIMHYLACVTKFDSPHNYLPDKWCKCSFLPEVTEAAFIHVRPKFHDGTKMGKMHNLMDLVDRGIISL